VHKRCKVSGFNLARKPGPGPHLSIGRTCPAGSSYLYGRASPSSELHASINLPPD